MSQEHSDKDTANKPLDDELSAGKAPPEEPETTATDVEVNPTRGEENEPPRSGKRRMPLLVLIAAVIALIVAASTWIWQGSQKGLEGFGASNESLEPAVNPQIQSMEQTVSTLQREVERLEAGRAALQDARQDTFNDMSELSQRVAGLERQVADVEGVSDETRKRWIIAEVEYYLQIANARLQLARDVKSAIAALRLADARLGALEDPTLMEVRGKIRGELVDLGAVQMPDIQGIALTLGNLSARVEQLPLSRIAESRSSESGNSVDENAAGWDRAVHKVGQAISGVISVRKTDKQATPLLTVKEEYFLKRNLELKLEAARVALLYGNETSYRESLRDARRWLGDYFDTEDAATSSAMNTLGELEAQTIHPALPDISGSLGLLKSLSANSGS